MAEYKRLLEEIKDAYFLLQDGKIALVNSKLAALYGYSGKDDVIGRPFIEVVAPEERERILEFYLRRQAGEEVPERYETVVLTKDGTRVPIGVSVWLTQFRGRPAVAGIAEDIREKQRQQAEHVRAKENERRRLAQALHDDTIQELLLVCHRLQDIAAGTYGQLPEPARERLAEVRIVVERTINEVRDFTQDLRPAVLDDMGLLPALRWLTDRLTAGDGVYGNVRVLGEQRRLPPDTELALFRIAQEALSNVRKHACASRAMVTLEFNEEKVTMSVSDNGRGFELPVTAHHLTTQDKMGLVGMSDRARLLGGTYKVESAPGKGTVVKVEVARQDS